MGGEQRPTRVGEDIVDLDTRMGEANTGLL